MPYKKLKPIAVAAGYGFPQLSEVFELVAGKGLLNIELKQAGHEEAAIRLARGILPVDSFAFSSFDPAAVRTCRRVAPDVPAFLIVWGPQDGARDVAALRELDASGIAFESGHLSAELTRLFCRERFPLFVWTVNDVCEAVRLAEWGVTGIITDIPAELVTAMNPSGKG
ncbi:glycerophosphodiester phosphodiesterase [bacterium]|nr:glycerophosphodiester phosphodiesterase [bacterium]